jgi:chromate transporter
MIIAIVLQALWSLGRTALRTRLLAGLAVAVLVASFAGVNELVALAGGGLVALLAWLVTRRGGALLAMVPLGAAAGAGAPAGATAFGLLPLFLFFVKIGAILFGSGYVLLAFLRADLVQRWHWLSESQLLDAIAAGQITPGPVFTTATFIGYVLGRVPGAAVATTGIFLPAFVFVAISGPLVPRLRRSAGASAFLDGVIVASLALMAEVTWHLGRAAIVDGFTLVLAIVSAIALFRFRLNSVWLVLAGAAAGMLLRGG